MGNLLRRYWLMGFDFLWGALSLPAALLLRFGSRIPPYYQQSWLSSLLFVTLLRLLVNLFFGLYRQLWQYAGRRELKLIVQTVTVGSLSILAAIFAGVLPPLPRSIFALDWFFNLAGYGAVRLFLGVNRERGQKKDVSGVKPKRVLIVGAGECGAMLVRDLLRQAEFEVVGFCDDDPAKLGLRIQGIPVWGTCAEIPALVARLAVQQVVIAMPSVERGRRREIFTLAQRTGVKVKSVPSLHELADGRVTVQRLREVQPEDLLGRTMITHVDTGFIKDYLYGKVVLVTGAGGSIGAELCRQIARLGPERLILLGRGENSIYEIEQELRRDYPELKTLPVIADIRQAARIERLCAELRPQIIYHAAAHKHVPLMELYPEEAITNNILGTANLLRAADRTGVERLILISTDKAVRPVSVMGATKRAAEILVQAMAQRSRTKCMAVRFGNVLGSRGSVIPLFRKQIEAGGPVTVTDPRMTRYFMTIPEAVFLVLHAGGLGRGGEVFLLDMGEPMRIDDLAREMIRAMGLEPDRDIEIRYIGIRPGEKLYEELQFNEETMYRTAHPHIWALRSQEAGASWEEVERQLQEFARLVQGLADAETLRARLFAFVDAAQAAAAPRVPGAAIEAEAEAAAAREAETEAQEETEAGAVSFEVAATGIR